jgi:hypothetical protein
MDSFNASYATYNCKSHDENLNIIDKTEMYVKFLEMLKKWKVQKFI